MSRPEKQKPNFPKAIAAITETSVSKGARLKHVGGSRSDDWNVRLVNDTVQALWLHSDQETYTQQFRAALAALSGIAPQDELEGMIAGQLVAAHSAAMECYRRAMAREQTFEGRHENLNQANKLSRSFAVLLDALNRHRGKGQQKVTVEHVHVHSGGQAVVGAVAATGGGDRAQSEEQPHAMQIAHAPEPAMPCPDPVRSPVPIASDGERPLPHARRVGSGGAEGE